VHTSLYQPGCSTVAVSLAQSLKPNHMILGADIELGALRSLAET
jgi:hypothetical protein